LATVDSVDVVVAMGASERIIGTVVVGASGFVFVSLMESVFNKLTVFSILDLSSERIEDE